MRTNSTFFSVQVSFETFIRQTCGTHGLTSFKHLCPRKADVPWVGKSYITLKILIIFLNILKIYWNTGLNDFLKYLVIGTFQTPPRTWCGLHKRRFFHRRWILLALIENWLLWSSQLSWRIASWHRRQPLNVELGYLWVFPHLFPWFRADCLNNSEIFSPLCIAVLVQ